LIKILKR